MLRSQVDPIITVCSGCLVDGGASLAFESSLLTHAMPVALLHSRMSPSVSMSIGRVQHSL